MAEATETEKLWQMATSYFMAARVLQVAAELAIFDCLTRGPLDAASIARRCKTSERGTEALMVALTSLGLVERSSTGQYRLTPSSHAHLVAGQPGYIGDIIAGASSLYQDWCRLEEAIRDGRGTAKSSTSRGGASFRRYLEAIDRSSRTQAQLLLAALDLSQSRRLLDVGGGLGIYSIALCQTYPRLQSVLLDLPTVVPIARQRIAEAGLQSRITARGGDYNHDDLGGPYDLVLLANVLHQERVGVCRALLAKVYGVLDAEGVLIIHDAFLDQHRTGPLQAALGGLNLFLHGEGGAHGIDSVMAWLQEVGFPPPSMQWQSNAGLAMLVARKAANL